MKEKPILFSGPMVRAILDGRKTMTRRVLKPQLDYMLQDKHERWPSYKEDHWQHLYAGTFEDGTKCIQSLPHVVGNLLWVRERLQRGENGEVCYYADGEVHPDAEWAWSRQSLPSIHCPRGLSRITLRVTAVKVERLQDISEEDAKAEGVRWTGTAYYVTPGDVHPTAKDAFAALWNSINGPGAWEANPWVAAYSFERVTP